MKPTIELPEMNMQVSAILLNTLLADEYVLITKTRNAHWNIHAKNFSELHRFFEEQYRELDTIIDGVAERVRMIGHFSSGSLNDFLTLTRLQEQRHDFSSPQQIIGTLLHDHESIIRILRKDIAKVTDTYTDAGTCDALTGWLKQHEKMAWMLRAHLS
jgi:starvation-inducible DNA-binding protein